jgi:hypothetical protein
MKVTNTLAYCKRDPPEKVLCDWVVRKSLHEKLQENGDLFSSFEGPGAYTVKKFTCVIYSGRPKHTKQHNSAQH